MDSIPTAQKRQREDEAIIIRYRLTVEKFCRSRTQSLEDARDAAHDTFARFMRRTHHHVDDPEAWLIRVANRACVDIYRRTRRAVTSLDAVDNVENSWLYDDRPVDPEQLAAQRSLLRQILRHLSKLDRFVLVQLYVYDCTYPELASSLAQSVPYTRVIAQRARDHARLVAQRLTHEWEPRITTTTLGPLHQPMHFGGMPQCSIGQRSSVA